MDKNNFPEKLYHYCNSSAFMSIIKNKCFWLSDTKYTNDKEEICAFKDAVGAALNELVCNKKINEEMANKIWITYVYNTLPGYISCFSEEDDLLSQWRSYGDDGNGVAIGVDFNSLSIERGGPFRMCNNEKKCYGRQVLYINELWKNEIKNFFKKILDGKKNMGEVSPDDLSEIFNLSYYTKNDGFKEEAEWRITYLPLLMFEKETMEVVDDLPAFKEIKFRSTRDKIISYFEFSFKPESVKEIILGPKNNFDVETLRMFLGANGFKGVNIKKSKIPYI